MVPGTVPAGLQATIRDQTTGASVTTTIVAGGFDPVPVAAEVDDTLQVEITRTGDGPLKGADLVKPIRPPTIVRTSPPKGGHDVPLNAVIVFVFSEPMDSATLTTNSIQLWRDSAQVAGAAKFADAAHLRVELHPDSLLARATDYRVLVTQGIRDVNGVALDSAVELRFTTGETPPPTGLVFASVSAGIDHTCAVTTTGKAYCWGVNAQGQLGDGATEFESATPIAVAGGLAFASISAGYAATCGVTTDGAGYCWGSGGLGGDSATLSLSCSPSLNCPTPLPVGGGHVFKQVSVGVSHACGVTTDGAAYCWGSNYNSEFGIDSTTLVQNCRDESPGSGYWRCPLPLPVAGGLTFTSVSTWEQHTCGVIADGTAYCWGGNASGELGNGTTSRSLTPVPVAGGLTFTSVRVGGDEFTCGVATNAEGYCWGRADGGALGGGSVTGPQVCVWGPTTSVPCSTSPELVTSGLVFKMISSGWYNVCGVTIDGTAYCWGWGNPGAISTPLPVSGGLTFASVSAGFPHMCGLTPGGVAYCWGINDEGELGDGTFTDSRGVPVKVAGQP
jgi:alpha-tubulin suppressor-like RCC1 family protein